MTSPFASCSMRTTCASGRRSSLPVAAALGSSTLERRPLGADLVPLEGEAVLDRCGAAVARHRVDGVAAGVKALVADALGAVGEHLVVVVGRQLRDAVGPRDPELRLGAVVVGLDVGEADRPVESVDAILVAVVGRRLELVLHEARAAPGPVNGGATDGLADPRGQVREVLRDAERARGRPLVEPGELLERAPLVVDEVVGGVMAAGFQDDDPHPLLAELVRQGPAPGA